MTEQELARYNGQNGQKAYIAYKGTIYDVTESKMWKQGKHANLHYAGVDLTASLANAPHSEEVFARFPVVGKLEAVESTDQEKWVKWYQKYHPHPMLVHFPIALHLFALGADLFFFLTPTALMAALVFYTFFVATIMGVFTMLSGILSWWVNYTFAMTHIFKVKLYVSMLTLVLGVIGATIYLEQPQVVYESTLPSIVYHATVIVTGFMVIILGHYGGKITWPKKE